MRVLVTGGAGVIGSHLCQRLLQDGNEVVCLDNLSCSSIDNVKSFMGDPAFTFLKRNVMEPLDIQVDQIYNLACPASPVHYQRDPVNTFKTSIFGAINMLDLANRYNARILQSSTSEIYGDPLCHPQKETYWGNVNPIGIRSCYDEGKRGAETLFFDYRRKYGTDIRVARIFNTYGPNMAVDDGRVISNFVIQALRNEDLTIYGDGSQTRCFCFVDDTVDGLVRLMNQTQTVGPVNIGNPDERTIKEMAEKIIDLCESTSRVISLPLPKDDPAKRRPDITAAKMYLGWTPRTSLDEGLNRTIQFFKNKLNK